MTTQQDDMSLPAGKTCGDCSHLKRCQMLFGCKETNVRCDWSPSRFAEKVMDGPDFQRETLRKMSDAEKIAAFDNFADAMVNQYSDGRWAWVCLSPSGGQLRQTKEEAQQDLFAWAERMAHWQRKKKPVVVLPE